MAKWHQIQSSFLQGELSPEFAAQAGQEIVAAGVKTAQNAFLLRSGAAVKAPGTVFVAEVGDAATHGKARIWPYINKDTNARLLATFTDGKVFVTDKLNTDEILSAQGWATSNLTSQTITENDELFWTRRANPVSGIEFSYYYTLNDGWETHPFNPTRSYLIGGGKYIERVTKPGHGSGTNWTEVQAGADWATLENHFHLSDTLPPHEPIEGKTADAGVVFTYTLLGGAAEVGGSWFPDLDGESTVLEGVDIAPSLEKTATVTTQLDRLNLRLRLAPLTSNEGTLLFYNDSLSDEQVRAFRQDWVENTGLRIKVIDTAGGTTLIDETVMNPLNIAPVHDLTDREQFFREYDLSGSGLGPGDELTIKVSLVVTNAQALFDALPDGQDQPTAGMRAVEFAMNIFAFEAIATGGGQALNIGEATTPYSAEVQENLHFLQSPFNDKALTVWHPLEEPYRLYFGGGPPEEWTFEPYAVSPQPSQWGTDNYPGVATAFQGRLVLTGAPKDPETVWASASGDWKDFDTSGTVTPASPIEFTPTERGENTWVSGFQRLLFGNTINEYSIDAQSGLLQATDVAVNQRSTYGALRMPQKTTFGRSVALPTAGNRAVRLLQYDDRAGGFVGLDASTHADHLFQSGIRRVFFTRDPQETLWCVLNDGRMAVMNMEPELDTPGWTWLDFSGGKVLDAAPVITDQGRTNLALLMQRERQSGEEYVTLEAMSDLRDRARWQYVNARVTKIKTPGVAAVAGFDHLDGNLAAVFVDGLYYNTQLVSGGVVQVPDTEGLQVSAGLLYTFKLETLPVGSADFRVAGLAGKKRFATMGVRMLDSGPPTINGMRPEGDRTPSMEMDSEPAYPGVRDYETTDHGWASNKTITVEEPEPFAVTLLGIYGKLATNEA